VVLVVALNIGSRTNATSCAGSCAKTVGAFRLADELMPGRRVQRRTGLVFWKNSRVEQCADDNVGRGERKHCEQKLPYLPFILCSTFYVLRSTFRYGLA
jgi:hypothetical protein